MAHKVNGRLYGTVLSDGNNSADSQSYQELKNIVESGEGSVELGNGDEDVDDGTGLLFTLHLHDNHNHGSGCS